MQVRTIWHNATRLIGCRGRNGLPHWHVHAARQCQQRIFTVFLKARLFTPSIRPSSFDFIDRPVPVPLRNDLVETHLLDQGTISFGPNGGRKSYVYSRLPNNQDSGQTEAVSNFYRSRDIANRKLASSARIHCIAYQCSPSKASQRGVCVRNLGTHVFSKETVFRLIQENEDNIRARRHGPKRQRIPSSSPDPLQEDVFL